jgi:DNA-binding MarR family transcriptional regulator
MKQKQIARVRRFNRAVTQRIGALDDAYLCRGRSLGLSRLLWEIEPAGSEVRLLRARLGLDSGYLSRQLRRLEADRLVTTDPDDGDGRVRRVQLTRKGIAGWLLTCAALDWGDVCWNDCRRRPHHVEW